MNAHALSALGLLLAAASAVAPVSVAAQAVLTCPPSLSLRIEKAGPSADSDALATNFTMEYKDTVAILKDADIFKGAGKGGQRTVPDESDEGKPAIYRKFQAFTNGQQPRGDLYAVCHYEGGVSLDRRIGQSAKSCKMERDQKSKADDKLEIKISCQGVTGGSAIAAPASAAAGVAPSVMGAGRMVDCVLNVQGKAMIKERCSFVARPGGSFSISNARYAAAVDVAAPGQGSGRWTGTSGAGAEPASDLGPLTRKGACWVNEADRTSICAR